MYIEALNSMKTYPKNLSFCGNQELLKRTKVSIVGTRKPAKYAKEMTHKLSYELSKAGICIVSGGAMGVDAIAHRGAGAENTIAVLPCGIDIKYPAVNKNLLTEIGQRGLLISQFENSFRAAPWSFVVRNELVVALGDILIVTEADLGSGSMRSVEFALKMGKEIYVLPHRVGESMATNKLLETQKAKAIYDLESFVNMLAPQEKQVQIQDDFLEFCKTNPSYEEALQKFPSRVFEAELSGEIEVKNATIYLA